MKRYKEWIKNNIRAKKFSTYIFGPFYKPNHKVVEMEITYACNLKCFNCNRSCRQAPSEDKISVGQIKKFIQESIDADRQWNVIKLMGGEPALHPNIFHIVDLLLAYKERYSPNTIIKIVSNKYGEHVNSILSKIPNKVVIKNLSKQSPLNSDFYAFNIAPIDSGANAAVDFGNGCNDTSLCGIGFTPYGFYPCAVGGGIDRIFGFNIGRKKLPSTNDLMVDQLRTLCPLCGAFGRSWAHVGVIMAEAGKDMMSKTWKKAYKRYKDKKPLLTLY